MLAPDLLLQSRIQARQRDAGIEMTPRLGELTAQLLTIGGMLRRGARSSPTLQHDSRRRLGELRVLLQEAIEAQEPASLRVVAVPSCAHQCDVIAHQATQDAAEGRGLAQRFERPIRLRRQQRPHDPRCGHGATPWARASARHARAATLQALPG